MDTKWKKSKAAIGFLAFLLGISLLLEGALYFSTVLTSSNSRAWLYDSFKSDFRRTREFQNFVTSRLENLITMGAGGHVYGYEYYYDTGRPNYYSINSNLAQAIHNNWKEDKNLLYRVEKEGEVLYSNSDRLTPDMDPSALIADNYGFLLQFDGEKVRIWLDGEEQNVYGGGYYRFEDREDSAQWYVPGYKNFTVDEAGTKVKVTMAVLNEPRIFIKGNYGSTGSDQYNQLYYTKQELDQWRTRVLAQAVRMGAGLALTAVYVLLRKDKKRADQAIARRTGKLWFEVKVLAALLLAFFCLPRTEFLGEVWQELTYAYDPSYGGASSAISVPGDISLDWETLDQLPVEERDIVLQEYGYAIAYPVEQTASVGTAVTILSENGAWLLREYLRELADHALNLLVVFWGLYLLAVNDWRYNPSPWKRGVFALLYAGELKYPLQRRLRRQVRGLILAFVLLAGVAVYLFLAVVANLGVGPPWWLLAVGLPVVLACVLAVLVLVRQRKLWTGLGQVSDQLAAVRSGALAGGLAFPKEHDLFQMADDLNHIRQGLQQAVEERTRSERMKVALVTNVSHDLKTPLTSILSYTELLAQEPLEPPASEYVQIMGEKAQRLKAMVQDVFEVSKAASGQLPVKLEHLDYARLLRQTLADMAQAIDESGLTLRTSIPDTEVPITADSDRLYRVFQNLIGNALKYSLPGSRVYLTLSVEEEQATASVKNTSASELRPGAEYTARFVRGDESRTDGGSGLGLSIAESFTKACGGSLTVSTEADLFTALVTFPLA
ncbi:MAG: HAMP domain-containing histidine kinase [Lawsonibacter sp.]|nr:HAMP domain-containing histidine kinase [Lawsonibacter sp.]